MSATVDREEPRIIRGQPGLSQDSNSSASPSKPSSSLLSGASKESMGSLSAFFFPLRRSDCLILFSNNLIQSRVSRLCFHTWTSCPFIFISPDSNLTIISLLHSLQSLSFSASANFHSSESENGKLGRVAQ